MHLRTIGLRLFVGLCLLSVVVWFGRHAADELQACESWIADRGFWGKIAFIGLVVVFTSVFVPDTVPAIAAGALFGLGWGTVLIVVGAVTTAALNYLAACHLLKPRIETMLEQHPKLQAIRNTANREGLKLQLLLRLAPINPVSVSYVLGVSGVRFTTFLIATVGLIPGLFLEVYFGYFASHVTKVAGDVVEHSRLHTVVVIAGFFVSVVLIAFVSGFAAKAIAEVESESVIDAQLSEA